MSDGGAQAHDPATIGGPIVGERARADGGVERKPLQGVRFHDRAERRGPNSVRNEFAARRIVRANSLWSEFLTMS